MRGGPSLGFETYVRMLRIHHTLFSLPFAYVGALMFGLNDWFDALMIGIALFSARSVALLANDLFDRDLDALNPRTADRPLVTGEARASTVIALIILFSSIFALSALYFNWLAFLLAFPILLAEITYPFAKRIHCFPHFHLGAVLGAVPLAGAIAMSDSVSNLPWGYAIALAMWVSGFDMVYAIQDVEVDVRLGIKSVPACFGERAALNLSLLLHIGTVLVLLVSTTNGVFSKLSIALTAVLLGYQHYLARRRRYAEAFNVNLVVSLLLGFGLMLDLLPL